MNSIKKIMFYLMIAVVLFSFMVPTTVCAQATIFLNSNVKIPIENIQLPQWIPCANGGKGDLFFFTGYIQIKIQMIIDPITGVHHSYQYNPQNAICIGMMTGDIYRATGITRGNTRINIPPEFPFEYTEINNFRLIGPGPGNDYTAHGTWHVRVNENGEMTLSIENVKAMDENECLN